MSEKKQLNDEELENVTGGYQQGNYPVEFRHSIGETVNIYKGFEYMPTEIKKLGVNTNSEDNSTQACYYLIAICMGHDRDGWYTQETIECEKPLYIEKIRDTENIVRC